MATQRFNFENTPAGQQLVIPGTESVAVFPASGGSRSFGEGEVVDATADLQVSVSAVFA